jgi:hypothetical protein
LKRLDKKHFNTIKIRDDKGRISPGRRLGYTYTDEEIDMAVRLKAMNKRGRV